MFTSIMVNQLPNYYETAPKITMPHYLFILIRNSINIFVVTSFFTNNRKQRVH